MNNPERTCPTLDIGYKPSAQGWGFHNSSHRIRLMVTGWKGGKCLHQDQHVMLSDGTTKAAGDLVVGDPIMGCEDGLAVPSRVVALEPAVKDCLELTFSDGTVARCSDDHRFPLWNQ